MTTSLPITRTVETRGARLAIRELGSGAPVLLVHGTAPPMWFDLPAALAARHRVIAYDRRSFGESDHPPLSIAAPHVEDAAAILDALGAAPAIIVGWSRGGILALELALARPDLVKALVLVEPPLGASRHASMRLFGGVFAAKLWTLVGQPERGAAAFLRAVLRCERTGEDGLARLSTELRQEIARDARAIVAEIGAGTGEASVWLERIAAPGIWLLGSDSEPSLEVCARRAKPYLPRFELTRVTGATHVMARDRPDAIADAVVRLASGT